MSRKCSYTISKDNYNKVLEKISSKIRLVLMDANYLQFSNGYIITDAKSVRTFKRNFRKLQINFSQQYVDLLYSNLEEDRKCGVTLRKAEVSALGGRKNWSKNRHILTQHSKIRAKENPEHLSKAGKSVKNRWQKGLTKQDDPRILAHSIRMKLNNPSEGGISKEQRSKQSNTMKEKILSGNFTPNSNNRLTYFNIKYRGKKYRSSWEVLFHHSFPDFEYESLRISYLDETSQQHIYIVDFVDHVNKIVVEVKPLCIMNRGNNRFKELALIKWCKENHYEYVHYDEEKMGNLCKTIDLTELEENIQNKLRGLVNEIKV